MFRLLDRFTHLLLLPLLWATVHAAKFCSKTKNNQFQNNDKKKMLFLCSGAPLIYPEDKLNNPVFRRRWDIALSNQLLHPTFHSTVALYLGARNTSYKLCPGVISIVVKKTNFKLFPKVSSLVNMAKLLIVANKINNRVGFYLVETFLPGDRLLDSVLISNYLGIPLTVQCQGDFDLAYFDEDPSKETLVKLINRNIIKFIFSIVLRHAQLVLGGSDHVASFAICNGAAPHKVRRYRIHSAIEEFAALNIPPKDDLDNFPINDPTIFLWCRLAPEKKLRYAIEAMKKVFTHNPNVKLLIAGDGPLQTFFEQQLHGFTQNVCFLGNLERAHLKAYVYHSDISLIPLAGHSLIEAGVCKKAVVGFNWEWHGEVITNHESGLLVDYPNTEALANAIIYLFEHPHAREVMGQKLHRRIMKLFASDSVIQRQETIWNEFHDSLRYSST